MHSKRRHPAFPSWLDQLIWVERERRRAEILMEIDKAEASLARGEGRMITPESMRELAEVVHQRGLARLAADEAKRR